jgi:hypothetical protein
MAAAAVAAKEASGLAGVAVECLLPELSAL